MKNRLFNHRLLVRSLHQENRLLSRTPETGGDPLPSIPATFHKERDILLAHQREVETAEKPSEIFAVLDKIMANMKTDTTLRGDVLLQGFRDLQTRFGIPQGELTLNTPSRYAVYGHYKRLSIPSAHLPGENPTGAIDPKNLRHTVIPTPSVDPVDATPAPIEQPVETIDVYHARMRAVRFIDRNNHTFQGLCRFVEYNPDDAPRPENMMSMIVPAGLTRETMVRMIVNREFTGVAENGDYIIEFNGSPVSVYKVEKPVVKRGITEDDVRFADWKNGANQQYWDGRRREEWAIRRGYYNPNEKYSVTDRPGYKVLDTNGVYARRGLDAAGDPLPYDQMRKPKAFPELEAELAAAIRESRYPTLNTAEIARQQQLLEQRIAAQQAKPQWNQADWEKSYNEGKEKMSWPQFVQARSIAENLDGGKTKDYGALYASYTYIDDPKTGRIALYPRSGKGFSFIIAKNGDVLSSAIPFTSVADLQKTLTPEVVATQALPEAVITKKPDVGVTIPSTIGTLPIGSPKPEVNVIAKPKPDVEQQAGIPVRPNREKMVTTQPEKISESIDFSAYSQQELVLGIVNDTLPLATRQKVAEAFVNRVVTEGYVLSDAEERAFIVAIRRMDDQSRAVAMIAMDAIDAFRAMEEEVGSPQREPENKPVTNSPRPAETTPAPVQPEKKRNLVIDIIAGIWNAIREKKPDKPEAAKPAPADEKESEKNLEDVTKVTEMIGNLNVLVAQGKPHAEALNALTKAYAAMPELHRKRLVETMQAAFTAGLRGAQGFPENVGTASTGAVLQYRSMTLALSFDGKVLFQKNEAVKTPEAKPEPLTKIPTSNEGVALNEQEGLGITDFIRVLTGVRAIADDGALFTTNQEKITAGLQAKFDGLNIRQKQTLLAAFRGLYERGVRGDEQPKEVTASDASLTLAYDNGLQITFRLDGSIIIALRGKVDTKPAEAKPKPTEIRAAKPASTPELSETPQMSKGKELFDTLQKQAAALDEQLEKLPTDLSLITLEKMERIQDEMRMGASSCKLLLIHSSTAKDHPELYKDRPLLPSSLRDKAHAFWEAQNAKASDLSMKIATAFEKLTGDTPSPARREAMARLRVDVASTREDLQASPDSSFGIGSGYLRMHNGEILYRTENPKEVRTNESVWGVYGKPGIAYRYNAKEKTYTQEKAPEGGVRY